MNCFREKAMMLISFLDFRALRAPPYPVILNAERGSCQSGFAFGRKF